MEEVFVEQIIKQRINASGIAFRMLGIILVMAGIFSMTFLGALGFTITALLIYVAYLIWRYTSVEYEYSLTNGELVITKILGQQKRKDREKEEFDIKQAEIIAPTFSDAVANKNQITKILDFSSGKKSEKLYSMIINHSGYGNVHVIFEPSEKMIEAMYHIRPNIVKKS